MSEKKLLLLLWLASVLMSAGLGVVTYASIELGKSIQLKECEALHGHK